MSQHSDSPRLEALESSVSGIQETMSELVGMLRQLTTETRTAGDGRRGEESGGARRDAAHIYSSGTRRGPLTAATGYRVTAVQDEGAGEATAARNFPVHHRAASEPADTRPGLPTGVGPMIDVRRGEARDPYLAGITAYDESRDVLRTDFKSLPARVVPPVLKAEKGGFQKFKHEFFLKANMLDITAHFVDQGMRAVPVGDPLKQKAVLLQEGFSNDEIRTAYQAWNFIDAALQSESDRSILKRCKSPREVFERLEKWHDPDSEVATQRLYDKFHEFTIPPHSDPITALHDLEDTNNQMHEKGIGRIPDAVVHARFVRALPDEYSLVKEMLQTMKNRDRDEIIRMVSTRHSNLPQKKGAQRTSRQPEQAFVSSESGNRSGARRGRDRGGGGRQGRGRRGNNGGGGGNNNSSGTPGGGASSSVGTQRSGDGSGNPGSGGDGRHNIPSGRCFRCRQRGHRRHDCTTRESDFVPRCNRCTGYGHEESSCSSDAAVLVVELPVPEEDLAVEAQAFAVSEAGKCSVTIGDAVGGVALDKQVMHYIADSAATCSMTPNSDGLTCYRECSRPLGLANGEEITIVGYGDLTVDFRTNHGWVRVEMNDVAHVPQLSYNLISLPSMAQKGHTYTGDKDGVTLELKGGKTVFFPLVGKLCRQYGYRPKAANNMVDSACAVIAPGKVKTPNPPPDINILHCTFGHAHEGLLKKTATQQGIAYSGELHECRGCSMAKGLRKPIARSTQTRADKRLQRVFVDLSGPTAVKSIGGKRYTLIVRDDCTRFNRVYFLRHKSDAASAFESFLAEVRADGIPSTVMAVRSDNGREFFGGAFGELCRKRCIKQEFTPADSPKYNGVAERALGLINDAATAARIQATELYPGAPDYPSLWAEAVSWACHALNCTATTANPGDKSPYEMWYGSPPPRGAVWPFLKPAVCRVKRNNKSLPKAQDCYYVGPGIDHPRDCIRVLTANRSILTTRNVTWRHVPLSRPAPPQQLPPIAEEGGSTAGEGASGERAPSQGGGGVEEVLDNESDLDDTKPIARSTHTGADTLCLSRAPAAAAPYCQRGGVYSGGGRERGGGVKSRRKEGARLGQRVQPRQRSGGVAPGVTRNPPTPSASPGRGGATGRNRSRGSGGAEGNPPTPSASPGRGGARGRMRSRGSGGAEGNPPTPSASPGRGSATGRIRSRGSGGAEGNPPTPSASPGRGGASGRIRSRGSGGAEGDTPTPSVPPGRADFGGINGNSGSRVSSSSSSSSSRTSSSRDSSSRTSSNTSTSRGDVPTLAGREAYRQKWDGKIPALQGGRTRSQSKKHQMDADTADALLTHAWRTEEEETTTERVHDLLLEEWLEKLERRGIGPRARGVRGCRVGRQGK